MKQLITAFSSIVFFFIMLSFPRETLSGATNGLLLWFQIVLPTLLPFFVIINLMIQTDSICYIAKLCHPLFHRLFAVSSNGSFAVLVGFLCGYPVGAKVTADLVRTNRISLNEGKYLLSFCNNTSPAFITSYIVLQNLKDNDLLLTSLAILYLSPILCSFLFRRFYCVKRENKTNNHPMESKLHFHFEILDNSIMDAFTNITKIGGYIILFSVLISLGQLLPIASILPALEITTGIPLLIKNAPSFTVSYISVLALTSFGGICAIAQTNSMLQGTKLSIRSYVIEKLITTLVTSLLTLLYVMISLR